VRDGVQNGLQFFVAALPIAVAEVVSVTPVIVGLGARVEVPEDPKRTSDMLAERLGEDDLAEIADVSGVSILHRQSCYKNCD
jgi:hypothetical protein